MSVETNNPSNLENTIKALLRGRSMSMRQLGALTKINVATISRMVSGKQRVNPEYLDRIACYLNVSPDVLYGAAGLNVDDTPIRSREVILLEFIGELFGQLEFQAEKFTKNKVEDELKKYETYARTEEGRQLILEKFQEKRRQIIGAGPFVEYLDDIHEQFVKAERSEEELAIIGSGLLYFVLSADAIPDYMFPIGYLDDALAVQIVWNRLMGMNEKSSQMPVELKQQNKKQT